MDELPAPQPPLPPPGLPPQPPPYLDQAGFGPSLLPPDDPNVHGPSLGNVQPLDTIQSIGPAYDPNLSGSAVFPAAPLPPPPPPLPAAPHPDLELVPQPGHGFGQPQGFPPFKLANAESLKFDEEEKTQNEPTKISAEHIDSYNQTLKRNDQQTSSFGSSGEYQSPQKSLESFGKNEPAETSVHVKSVNYQQQQSSVDNFDEYQPGESSAGNFDDYQPTNFTNEKSTEYQPDESSFENPDGHEPSESSFESYGEYDSAKISSSNTQDYYADDDFLPVTETPIVDSSTTSHFESDISHTELYDAETLKKAEAGETFNQEDNYRRRDLPPLGLEAKYRRERKAATLHSGHGYKECRHHDECGYGEECCVLKHCFEDGSCFKAYECSRICSF